MPRKKRWEAIKFKDGVQLYRLFSWKYFDDFIRDVMLDYRQFIWRGQASSKWNLESTLDRKLKKLKLLDDNNIRNDHLKRFKLSTRGRRGINPTKLINENEWWALGQHYGLDTPLLDWTSSPFVAAFFAFVSKGNDNSRYRTVFGIAKKSVERKSDNIIKKWKEVGRPPIIEVVEPYSDENIRLVNQGGLFSRTPDGVDVESWVIANHSGDKYITLLKIEIPNKDRELCLRSLNRMNINYLSLFPDLIGSSLYCNLDNEIKNY